MRSNKKDYSLLDAVKGGKKVLASLVLTLALVFSNLCGMYPLPAVVYAVDNSVIHIGDVSFAVNSPDYNLPRSSFPALTEGSASVSHVSESGTYTLKLNNATIANPSGYAINCPDATLNIVLTGNSTISGNINAKNLIISGTRMSVNGVISSTGNMSISGAHIDITGGSTSISSETGLNISDSYINASGGISNNAGSLAISNSIVIASSVSPSDTLSSVGLHSNIDPDVTKQQWFLASGSAPLPTSLDGIFSTTGSDFSGWATEASGGSAITLVRSGTTEVYAQYGSGTTTVPSGTTPPPMPEHYSSAGMTTFASGTGVNMSFTINRNTDPGSVYEEFQGLYYKGTELVWDRAGNGNGDYKAESGSVKITVYNSFFTRKNIRPGNHFFIAKFSDGAMVPTTFNVVGSSPISGGGVSIYSGDNEPLYTRYTLSSGNAVIRTAGGDIIATVKTKDSNDDSFEHFKSLQLNGVQLQKGLHFTIEKGSTIITIKKEALKDLYEGTNYITAFFDDGDIVIPFDPATVPQGNAKGSVKGAPKTGEI